MADTTIKSVRGREVLDSRGNPTVEAEVTLGGGAVGWAAGVGWQVAAPGWRNASRGWRPRRVRSGRGERRGQPHAPSGQRSHALAVGPRKSCQTSLDFPVGQRAVFAPMLFLRA